MSEYVNCRVTAEEIGDELMMFSGFFTLVRSIQVYVSQLVSAMIWMTNLVVSDKLIMQIVHRAKSKI